MAWDSAWEGELLEQPSKTLLILSDVGIDLAVGSLEISIGDDAGATVTWANDINHVQIGFLDHAIQMRVDEIQAGRRSPMTQQPRLDVAQAKRLL